MPTKCLQVEDEIFNDKYSFIICPKSRKLYKEPNWIRTFNRNHIHSYYSADTIADKGTARIWKYNNKCYIVTSWYYKPKCVEVVPFCSSMPNREYGEELTDSIMDYYNSKNFYTGMKIKSGKNFYICNGKDYLIKSSSKQLELTDLTY